MIIMSDIEVTMYTCMLYVLHVCGFQTSKEDGQGSVCPMISLQARSLKSRSIQTILCFDLDISILYDAANNDF